MLILSDFGRALGTLIRPRWTTKNFMYIGQSMSYYYRMSAIPVLVFIAVGLLFSGSVAGFGIDSGTFFNYGFGGALGIVLAAVVGLWILNPIRIVVFSGLVHLFGRHLFGFFRDSYDNTLAASVYGITPAVMLSWAPLLSVAGASLAYLSSSQYALPHQGLTLSVSYALAGLFFVVIAEIWSLMVMLIALYNQQGVSRARSLLVLAVAGGVGLGVVLVATLAVSAFAHVPFYSLFGSVYQFL